MRSTDEDLQFEVTGTSIKDWLEVNAWYGGELVAEHLSVESWQMRWDAGRQVQGQTSWIFKDPNGDLAPWTMDDPLAPGGARLQVTWISGTSGLEVPMGWYRIRSSDPAEQWRIQKNANGVPVWVPGGGGSVSVDADDLTCIPAELDRLDAEPVVEATCLAEAVRLLKDVIPVEIDPAVTDRAVPASLVYDVSRMDAIEDHLQRVEAVHRMGPGGELEVLPASGLDPVWTIAGGSEGVLIKLARSMSDEGVYNAAISTAQPEGGVDAVQLVGRAYIEDGPLAWGADTPFGRRPIFHQSPATTQTGVTSDATTLLSNRQISGEVELKVECLYHPALQLQDRVNLVPPSLAGDFPIIGRVTGMTASSADRGVMPKQMSLRVAVSVSDLEVLARQVRGRG